MIEVKNPSALEMFLNHYLNGLEINSPLEEYVEQVKDFPFWCACLKSGQYIGFSLG